MRRGQRRCFVPDPPFIVSTQEMSRSGSKTSPATVYSDVRLPGRVQLTLGVSATSSTGRSFEEDQFNPKIGLIWYHWIGRRFAGRHSGRCNRGFLPEQHPAISAADRGGRIQPVLLLQWRARMSGAMASRSTNGFRRHCVRIEFAEREIETPIAFLGPPEQSFVLKTEEVSGRAYFFWTPVPTQNSDFERNTNTTNRTTRSFPHLVPR